MSSPCIPRSRKVPDPQSFQSVLSLATRLIYDKESSDMMEFVKAVLILIGFFGVVPVMATAFQGRRKYQQIAFSVMCFMTIGGIWWPSEWGLTVDSVETYRGHTKGFHFYFLEFIALALILVAKKERPREFRWLPPGLLVYYAYCFLSLLSIIDAPHKDYVLMAFLKFFKASLVFIATWNFIRTEEDWHRLILSYAVAMGWETVAVLNLKYHHHIYQVPGTFEHQNSLAMFAGMIGMVFLSAGLGPKHRWSNYYLYAYLACALCVQSTLSRGGLVVYIMGTGLVVGMSLIDKPTPRRFAVVGALGAAGLLGLALTLNTIIARFHDKGNESSGETRDLLNAASRHMLADHPLGIGWNNFAAAINWPFHYGDIIDDWELDRGHKVDPDYQKGVVESHYYLLLSETGYQGYTTYIVFITVFLYWNLRGFFAFKHHIRGCLSLGIFAGCANNYLQSLLERVLTQQRNLMLWLILLAVASRIEYLRREAKRSKINAGSSV